MSCHMVSANYFQSNSTTDFYCLSSLARLRESTLTSILSLQGGEEVSKQLRIIANELS
jgi:hypothetical protein